MKGNKKKLSKVLLSSTLLLTMFFTTMPTSVFAAENVASSKAGDVDLKIDETNFPDANFRKYIKNTPITQDTPNNIDKNGDGSLSQDEINATTTINLFGKGISNLKGIEYFTALTELNCNTNKLKDLDVSKNLSLTKLDCCSNNLMSLKLGLNTSLTELSCNVNQLPSLDVSQNVALTKLQCSQNQLTSLDVSKNVNVVNLHCEENRLTSLNIGPNTSITNLICDTNQLTNLDVSKNTALTDIDCANNELTSLDVSKNVKLASLACYSNKLTSLDVSSNILLTKLFCEVNLLTNLDVSKNTALTQLRCVNNLLTNLDVSKNTDLTQLICFNNLLTNLDVSKNTSLTELNCSSNQLANLDVIQNVKLDELRCQENKLTNLDVSKNKSLTTLFCNNNQLISLDVSQNPDLGILDCHANQLTSLDVSKNPNISYDCSAQTRTITYDKNKGYLLSEYDTSFDKNKATNFVGANYKDGTLTGVTFGKGITYDYDIGCNSGFPNTPMNVTLTFVEKKDKPTITVGSGSNHQVNTSNDMTFTCSGKLEDLNGVYVDGKLVAESNYTLKSGSTILTLKSSYLDTLSVGKHILKFQYKDNVAAETNFTITTKTDDTTVKPSTPNTGDTSNTMLCFGLMILS
ncbi:MAG: hypothetical protein RR378_08160, partial [Erysipelotrichaceae bacterium]